MGSNLILFFNQSHIGWLDAFMPYFRNKILWSPLYIFIIAFLIWNFPKNGLWMVLFALLTIGVSDTVSSQWIKKNVKRPRPCSDALIGHEVVLRIKCGGGYSFTSSHATNHAAIALFLFFTFGHERRLWRYLLVVWAITIGIAQIYVGVHYPLDVGAGLIIGSLIGWMMSLTFQRLFKLE
ncbi:MAG: phosphatase PAP2 family protein [Saprospiraceae bacterium]|nr:phosphatase PAP2 family protein [Saprospiraceae bacterium]